MASQFTLGIIVGGLISIANFYWLKHDLYKIFQRLTDRVKSRVMFKYYIRLTVTAVVLYFIIDPICFMLSGYSSAFLR